MPRGPYDLGIEYERIEDRLVGTFVPKADHRGPPGMLHGGIAATALDEVMAALGWAVDGVRCVTATLELKYRHGVPIDGRPVRVESWRERREPRRMQRVKGHLRLADGTVAVEATGIFVQVGAPSGDE